jgi:hypothetical protein
MAQPCKLQASLITATADLDKTYCFVDFTLLLNRLYGTNTVLLDHDEMINAGANMRALNFNSSAMHVSDVRATMPRKRLFPMNAHQGTGCRHQQCGCQETAR